MNWRDGLLLVPILLVGVMAAVLVLGLPQRITRVVLGASGGSIVAYLALERIGPRRAIGPKARATNAPSTPEGDAP